MFIDIFPYHFIASVGRYVDHKTCSIIPVFLSRSVWQLPAICDLLVYYRDAMTSIS